VLVFIIEFFILKEPLKTQFFCHPREYGNPEFKAKNILYKCNFMSLSELRKYNP